MGALEDLYAALKTHDDIVSELKIHKLAKSLPAIQIAPNISLEMFNEIKNSLPLVQLICTSKLGQISVIHAGCTFQQFEIFCVTGELFSGIRRYKTINAAKKTIVSLLVFGMFDETVNREFDVWNDLLLKSEQGSEEIKNVNLPDWLNLPDWIE